MNMTQEGLALIRRCEGFRGSAYRCPSGIWTIGYGHTSEAGPPAVNQATTMSQADAEKLLAADVERFAGDVRAALKRDLDDAQFSALVSFAYNVGSGGFKSSSVLKSVNAGDFNAVPRLLGLWGKGGGRVLPGLVARRAAEAEMFMRGGDETVAAGTGKAGPIETRPVSRSTTIISALMSAIAALISGAMGQASGSGGWALFLMGVSLVAAGWIVRERLRKAKEETI